MSVNKSLRFINHNKLCDSSTTWRQANWIPLYQYGSQFSCDLFFRYLSRQHSVAFVFFFLFFPFISLLNDNNDKSIQSENPKEIVSRPSKQPFLLV